jgi:hypothetical protein
MQTANALVTAIATIKRFPVVGGTDGLTGPDTEATFYCWETYPDKDQQMRGHSSMLDVDPRRTYRGTGCSQIPESTQTMD